MTNEKQIAANRRNAEKCSGPKTEGGKAESSQNVLKTGIDSKTEAMQCESRDKFNDLIVDFYRDYHPFGAIERGLLATMIRMAQAPVYERRGRNPGSCPCRCRRQTNR